MRINESGGRRYLQVVESCRNEAGKPRHRVVANLARIDGMADGHLDALIRGLCRAAGRDEPATPEITHAPARAYGNVFALHELWKELGFDRALGRALRSGKRRLDVEALVRTMSSTASARRTRSWAACAGWRPWPCRPCPRA